MLFRFCIVGAGNIGGAHKEALMLHEECVLAAICDLVPERAQALAEGTDAVIYTDYRQMVQTEKPDAVILNLPHGLHKEATIFCLEAGCAVLLEKPMANTVSECDAMVAAAQRAGKPLSIGHLQRFFPQYKKVRGIIQSGELGRLSMISLSRDTAYFVNRPAWFWRKEQAGGGIVMNYGAHSLDRILSTTSLHVDQVSAVGNNFMNDHDVEAGAQILLRLTGGVTAVVSHCGCNTPYRDDTYFYFTDGAIWISGSQMFVSRGDSGYEEIALSSEEPVMYTQLKEFVKLLNNEENEMATAEYGREVIAVIQEAFELMGY